MAWYWDHYLADRGRRSDPLASPLRASSHCGLPPALVITAEFDPLRDEGEAYAKKLRAAGVPVMLTRYEGMIHGFFSCGGAIDAAHRNRRMRRGASRRGRHHDASRPMGFL